MTEVFLVLVIIHKTCSGPEVIKLFSFSIVGILTFISRKNSILGLSEKRLDFLIFFILMSI